MVLLMIRLIRFTYEQEAYELPITACAHAYIVLPDYRVLSVTQWLKTTPQALRHEPGLDAKTLLAVCGDQILAKKIDVPHFLYDGNWYGFTQGTIAVLPEGIALRLDHTTFPITARPFDAAELADLLGGTVAYRDERYQPPKKTFTFFFEGTRYWMEDIGEEDHILLDDGRMLSYDGWYEGNRDAHNRIALTFETLYESTMSEWFTELSLEERIRSTYAYYATKEDSPKPLCVYYFRYGDTTYVIGKRAGTLSSIVLPDHHILALDDWKEQGSLTVGLRSFIELDATHLRDTHEVMNTENYQSYQRELVTYNRQLACKAWFTIENGVYHGL